MTKFKKWISRSQSYHLCKRKTSFIMLKKILQKKKHIIIELWQITTLVH